MPEFVNKNRGKGKISRRELLTLAWCRSGVPDSAGPGAEAKGKVTLTSAQCTGCGLCAVDCPVGALTISSNETDDAIQLQFKPDICDACGRCVATCPEKCLSLEHVPEAGPSGAVVLFEDRLVRCRECRSVIGPQAMLDRVQARMQAAGQVFPVQLELCPDCRAKAQFNLDREKVVRKR